jgi:hypothetical protein
MSFLQPYNYSDTICKFYKLLFRESSLKFTTSLLEALVKAASTKNTA